jgi:hypothetical protein
MASLPPFGLGTVVLAVFVLCAGFVMLRGAARLVSTTVVFALSAWAALTAWRHAPEWSLAWFGRAEGWLPTAMPVAAFVVAWLVIRKTLRLLIRPLDEEGTPGRSLPRIVFGLIAALIPAVLIWLLGAVFIHHSGSVDEIRSAASGRAPARGAFEETFAAMLPKSWLEALDPLADPSRVALAKWIATDTRPDKTHDIDPVTGKRVPRAIVIEYPELHDLAKQGRFGALLRHPRLTRALEDPAVKEILTDFRKP